MAPIRVRALYTAYPHWGAHAGGHQVCRYFDRRAVDVSLAPVADGDGDWPMPAGRLNTALRNRVSRRVAWYKLSDLAAELRTLPACLRNAIDVVHYLDAEHTAQFLPLWRRWLLGSSIRTVATFHQPPELLARLVSPTIVEHLDLVLVVSPTQEAFFRQFLPAERVRTLLHGVDAAFFRPGDSRVPDGLFRCVTAGHWMRDWPAVRAVAERLVTETDVEFHVISSQPTGLDDLPNVRQHRDVDDEALRRLYQDADVLFLPLINATANNTLLEGLACGLPIVSTMLPSVATYVGDTPAFLVSDNAPDLLVAALLELRRDVELRGRMGRASRARGESLAWPRIASEWQSAYAAVLGRDGSGR